MTVVGNLPGSGISSGSIDYLAGKGSVPELADRQRLRTLAHVHPGQPRNLVLSRPTNDFLYATIASGGGSSNLSLNKSLEVSGSVRVATITARSIATRSIR